MPTPDVSAPQVRRHSVWRWILGGLAVVAAAIALAVYDTVTLTREAGVLRDEVAAALGRPMKTRIQVTVGPVLLDAVRLGLHFVHNLPPDARDGLAAVRLASVGVYELRGPAEAGTRAQMFAPADAAMNRRGWVRIVGVSDRENTVLIYTPAKAGWGGTQRVCLAVCNRREVVVVAATADTAALARLAARHADLAKL